MQRALVLRIAVMALVLALVPAHAAPLPDDAALNQPVALAALDQPTGETVAHLAKLTGINLSVDEAVPDTPLTVVARDLSLRELMNAIAEVSRLEWSAQPGGGYRLVAPSLAIPVLDTRSLVRTLTLNCPPALRPQAGAAAGGPFFDIAPPTDSLYSVLPRDLLSVVEDGGQVPFPQIPSAGQRAVMDYRRSMAQRSLVGLFNPRWFVPADCLGLQTQGFGMMQTLTLLQIVVRDAPPTPGAEPGAQPGAAPVPPGAAPAPAPVANLGAPWRPIAMAPYQPGRRPTDALSEEAGTRLSAAATAAAQRLGVSIVLRGGGLPAMENAAPGATPEETLQALVPSEFGDRMAWKGAGKLFWLQPVERRGSETPELQGVRQQLEALLPAYKPLFGMDATQRRYAVMVPWAKVWQSLKPEQRVAGVTVALSELPVEQQALLVSALQLDLVERFWTTLSEALSGDLQRSVVALEFERASMYGAGGLGYPREIKLREGDKVLLGGRVMSKPLILRLLPPDDNRLSKHADIQVKEEPLAAVADRFAQLLGAPVVVEEPADELKLTADLTDKPLRLLMHWMERHTGLQWSKREGAYVLATPVPAAQIAGDPRKAVDAMRSGIPEKMSGNPYGEVPKGVTDADRQRLAEGKAGLGDLSPGLQNAIREVLYYNVRNRLTDVDFSWQLLSRLSDAKIRLDVPPGGGGSATLRVEVPGMAPQMFPVPLPGAGNR